MGFEGLIEAYEKWIKTPEGKKRLEETKGRHVIEIKELPKPWELNDKDYDKPDNPSYVLYWDGEDRDLSVELHMDHPIQYGGKESIRVTLQNPESIDKDETILWEKSVEGVDFLEVAKKANEFVLDYMRKK
jgi:hypothetical protein